MLLNKRGNYVETTNGWKGSDGFFYDNNIQKSHAKIVVLELCI